jgi:hypothetical protein
MLEWQIEAFIGRSKEYQKKDENDKQDRADGLKIFIPQYFF